LFNKIASVQKIAQYLFLKCKVSASGVARVPWGKKYKFGSHQRNCGVWKWKIRAKMRKNQWRNNCCWDFCSNL